MRFKALAISVATIGLVAGCTNLNLTSPDTKKTTTDKIEMKKYDPVVRKHVIYKEAKIK